MWPQGGITHQELAWLMHIPRAEHQPHCAIHAKISLILFFLTNFSHFCTFFAIFGPFSVFKTSYILFYSAFVLIREVYNFEPFWAFLGLLGPFWPQGGITHQELAWLMQILRAEHQPHYAIHVKISLIHIIANITSVFI